MNSIRQIHQPTISQAKPAAMGNGTVYAERVDFSRGSQGAYSLSNPQRLQAFSSQIVSQASETTRFEATRYGVYSLDSLGVAKQQEKTPQLEYVREERLQNLQLSIETKEGDVLNIEITADSGELDKEFANRLVYKFDVQGDLNGQEVAALGQLLPELMGDAAEFFQSPNGLVQLDSLQSVNRNQIQAVDIDLSTKNSRLDANYAFDEASNMHSLDVNQNNYRYHVEVSGDALFLSGDIENNADIKQYLELIDGVMEDHYGAGYLSKSSFFSTGLVSLMSIATQPEETSSNRHSDDKDSDSRLQRQAFDVLLPKAQVAVKRMFSGLPDFRAEFNSPVSSPNPKNSGELDLLNIGLSQKTGITNEGTSAGLLTHIKQDIDVDIDSRKHSRLPGRLQVDFEKGDYVYEVKKLHYKEQRSLDVLESTTPTFAQVSQHTTGESMRKEVRNDEVVARESKHIDHSTVQDMLALVSEKQSPNDTIKTLINRQMVEEVLGQYEKLKL